MLFDCLWKIVFSWRYHLHVIWLFRKDYIQLEIPLTCYLTVCVRLYSAGDTINMLWLFLKDWIQLEIWLKCYMTFFLCVVLIVHFSISLDNGQLDAQLLYFTIHLLYSSTCFKHYMLIIRRLNCIDAASGIFLSFNGRPLHRLRENSQPLHRMATDWEDDTRCCIETI